MIESVSGCSKSRSLKADSGLYYICKSYRKPGDIKHSLQVNQVCRVLEPLVKLASLIFLVNILLSIRLNASPKYLWLIISDREPDCSTFKQLFSVPRSGFLEGCFAPWSLHAVLAHTYACDCSRCLPQPQAQKLSRTDEIAWTKIIFIFVCWI